ncbi:MAG TPA: (2Fe-2S)-binding protein [Solirubrobacteraceae bacterium]|nr:(2Fe-2S)-binding protein [Solirubrobacteraceae bacterium]
MNRRPRIAISVDGRPVTCRDGETIAAALIGAGETAWRATRRTGARRGLFCGIGVCFDCLVMVNGDGPVRACLVTAQPGDRISTGSVERAASGARADDLT